jgi:hypothetical protein
MAAATRLLPTVARIFEILTIHNEAKDGKVACSFRRRSAYLISIDCLHPDSTSDQLAPRPQF